MLAIDNLRKKMAEDPSALFETRRKGIQRDAPPSGRGDAGASIAASFPKTVSSRR